MTAPTTTTAAGEPVIIPSAWELDWVALDTSRDGNVPGPVWKPLYEDPDTGSLTFMMHLPPNWHDPELDWHPTTEEGYILAGQCVLGDGVLDEQCYLYRPPGILHGPVAAPVDAGATILQRMDGEIRILRHDGGQHAQPITDQYKDSPVEWTERFDLSEVPFEPVSDGGWAGTSLKWVHRNKVTGGGAVIIDIPAGWSGSGSAARGALEEFVISGTLDAGGVRFGRWGFAQRPAGQAAGTYHSEDGATLFCWWNGANEL